MISCIADSTRVPDTYFLSPVELCFLQMGESSSIRSFCFLTPLIASLFAASARQGGVVPENPRIAPVIRSGRWTWRGHRLKPHDCLCTTVVRSEMLRSD